MFRLNYKHLNLNFKYVINNKRFIITGPTKTGANLNNKSNNNKNNEKDSKSSSGSLFDSSFTFQLFLIVGAMGAGYTLGKTTILTSPPATLFPSESITPTELLVEYEKIDKEIEKKQYDMFRRCILRILESKGIEIDMKYGKNEFLYEENFCNKDISDIMNTEDGLNDVFFGKDSKSWEGKEFIWYPESTNDVSIILKYCDEFKIPIYTSSSNVKTNGLVFSINYRYFKQSKDNKEENNLIKLPIGFNNKQISEILKNNDIEIDLNSNLNAIDLFLIKCGIKLNDFNKRLIGNNIDKDLIIGFDCVLPDGKILNLNKKEDSLLFEINQSLQDILCIITEVYIDKSQLIDKDKSEITDNLIVVGSNELNKLNEIIKEIKGRIDIKERNISIIDNIGCNQIDKTFGSYKTFALVKLSDKELNKLNKKFSNFNNEENNPEIKIVNIKTKDIEFNSTDNIYFSNNVKIGDKVLLIRNNIADENSVLQTYHETTPIIENEEIDYDEKSDETQIIKRGLLRRLKLAVDNNRILNRNVGITVTYKGE